MRMVIRPCPATGTWLADWATPTGSSGPLMCIKAAETCCSRMGTSRSPSAVAHVSRAADSGRRARRRVAAEEVEVAEEAEALEVARLRVVAVVHRVEVVRQAAEVPLLRLLLR